MKGLLFDYGGTIDSNGRHWAEVIWEAYQQQQIPVSKEAFREAYVFGERTLAKNPLVQPQHNFLDVMTIKVQQQFRYLAEQGLVKEDEKQIAAIAEACNAVAVQSVARAKPILQELATRFPLILVSNFYGNIETILSTFGIRHLFNKVIESAVVGVRKPDPAIFSLGVMALGFAANECVVIGDSFSKDIAPAHAIGCQTIWLKGEGWGDDPADVSDADVTITDFEELPEAIAGLQVQKTVEQ